MSQDEAMSNEKQESPATPPKQSVDPGRKLVPIVVDAHLFLAILGVLHSVVSGEPHQVYTQEDSSGKRRFVVSVPQETQDVKIVSQAGCTTEDGHEYLSVMLDAPEEWNSVLCTVEFKTDADPLEPR